MEWKTLSEPDRRFWPLLFLGFFLILFVAELLEKSMFIDGVWYAVISNNLANGVGSFWQPQFSSTIFSEFHEHPPLIFGIQALFFKLFGNHFLTERIFSAVLYILLALTITSLWRKALPKTASYRYLIFLPLILWQANIVNYFFLPANLLDTPLAILSALAIYSLWISTRSKNPLSYLILAGVILGLSILTKGVTGLFPLAFILLHWVLFRPYDWKNMVVRSLMVVASLTLFFAILFLFIPSSVDSLKKYLDVQLLASLSGERRLYYYQTNRLYIIGQLFWALLPMISFSLVIVLLEKALRLNPVVNKRLNKRTALLFILIGLSASLPIMISPRQALPYLIPSLVYFSLAVGVWTAPKVEALLKWLRSRQFPFIKIIELSAFSLCFLGSFLIIKNFDTSNNRDLEVIEDAKTIGNLTGPNQIISSTTYDMYISGYLMRFHNINLDTVNREYQYLITKKEEPLTSPKFNIVAVETNKYLIYKRNTVLGEKQQ
ncbi:MAG: ArnT family glycosyltransferase [Saprospiraceae bacterium]